MGTFVISKRFNDQYKFVFTSKKGNIIFSSLSYELKFECEEAIERFKAAIEHVTFLNVKASNGTIFFKILIDGVHFATSRKYTTELRIVKSTQEIVKNAKQSEVLDFSVTDFIFSDII